MLNPRIVAPYMSMPDITALLLAATQPSPSLLRLAATFSTRVTLSAPALCIDGSPAVYYVSHGTNATAWLFHHQGSGWCQTLGECAERAKGQYGSSSGYPATMDLRSVDIARGPWAPPVRGHNHFDRNCSVNPLFCRWNFVYMPSCDGQSFAGGASGSFNGTKLHFRGRAIREAVMASLRQRLGTATHAVITGCSSGGAATFFHVDWYAEQLPHAMTRGMPDSGVFLDGNYARDHKDDYGARMANLYTMANVSSGLPPACVAVKGQKCLFAEHVIPFLRTPLFAINSAYDASMAAGEYMSVAGRPLGNFSCPEYCEPTRSPSAGPCAAAACVASMNAFGHYISVSLTTLLKAPHGLFLDSCYRHCGQLTEQLGVGGLSPLTAFKHWFETGALPGGGTQWRQGKAFPCPGCCARQQRDGYLRNSGTGEPPAHHTLRGWPLPL